MPTYVYRCKSCDHEFETVQKIKDDPLTECPCCSGKLARLLFPPSIVFKGSGFHINDYPSSGLRGNGANSDAKPVETKTIETKSEDKSELRPSCSGKSS